MKRFRVLGVVVFVTTMFLSLFYTNAFSGELLHENSLKYIGAFRLPLGRIGLDVVNHRCEGFDDCVFAYGGLPIAVDPSGNGGEGSIFIGSHVYSQKIAELSIPKAIKSNNLNDLNFADVLQGFYDITEGNNKKLLEDMAASYSGSTLPGGMFVYGDKLIGSILGYYPNETQIRSHYVSGKELSKAGDFSGMYQIKSEMGARFFAGYMDTIPLAWQEKLGGKAITGTGGVGLQTTTSVGPSAFVFNPEHLVPEHLGIENPVPSTALMYYTLTNPLVVNKDSKNSMFNATTNIKGMAFPDGYDSILFFGGIGYGDYCYGIGTTDASLHGTFIPDNTVVNYCYDPSASSKGPHMYPYRYQVWAYNANDLERVKKGELKPWDVRPYETWTFEMPFKPLNADIQGTSYDKKNRRLYISQADGDGPAPVIHVFEIDPPTDRPAPAPPTNLSISQ